jgi:hypothetical protein
MARRAGGPVLSEEDEMTARWMSRVVLMVIVAAGAGFARGDEVERGTRVRVRAATLSSETFQGKVMSMTDDALTLRNELVESGPDAIVRIPRRHIDQLEVWRGRERTTSGGRGFWTGAKIGGLVGLGIGGLLSGLGGFQSDENAFTGAPFQLAVCGAAAGGLLELASSAGGVRDVWEPVFLPEKQVTFGVGLAPGGGWQARVAVRF